jgi:GTPase Era involved in 16S rRNA processing
LSFCQKANRFYDEDQITDLYERDIAADLVRESALVHLRDEVPHGIAVRVDEFTERGEEGAYIAATLFVERDSHKGIVIGKGGEMLKRIGSTARKEIEAMSGRKVFLELRVKVNKNWRTNTMRCACWVTSPKRSKRMITPLFWAAAGFGCWIGSRPDSGWKLFAISPNRPPCWH